MASMNELKGLTEGRIVHYVYDDKNVDCLEPLAHRPAMVVRVCPHVWGYPPEEGRVNLQVFTDGSNDWRKSHPLEAFKGTYWATSVPYSAEPKPHTWHWIEPA